MAKKRRRRKVKLSNILFLFLFVFGVFYFVNDFMYKQNLKPVSENSQEVIFTVPDGSTIRSVCNSLDEQGIVKNGNSAYKYARLHNLADVKAGNFLINKNWDVPTILATLNDSTATIVDEARVTIVEGDWVKHIARKISEVTSVTEEELLTLWNDTSYLQSLQAKYPFLTDDIYNPDIRYKLEGYLAPNTYIFFQDTTAQEVTEKLLDQSLAIYNELEPQFKKSDLSIHEIYTLASIVQYESSKVDDMYKIAGVFYNRMAIDMPLQSSVTVCYAIDIEREDDWMNCETNSNFDSPYNTYKYPGLPPGPIVNPGMDAIKAVLDPDDNEYYYFMADVYGDGTVYYAKTLEEHNANVAKYLK